MDPLWVQQSKLLPRWNASRGLAVQSRSTTDSKILSLRGIVIQTIANTESTGGVDSYTEIEKIVQNACNHEQLLEVYGNEHTLKDILAKVLTAGIVWNEKQAEDRPYVQIGELILRTHRECSRVGAKLLDEEMLNDFMANPSAERGFGETVHRLWSFFWTTAGNMGICTRRAEPGELICLLYGGQMLSILRPIEGATDLFRFIGECYLHDAMYGESLEFLKKGEVDERWFDLR